FLRILADDGDPEYFRRAIWSAARDAGRAVPLLADEKNTALLGKVFEQALAIDLESSLPHYIVFHYLQGTLDGQIAHFQKRAQQKWQREKASKVLFYLHRAKGDVVAARAAAEMAREDDLLVDLLEENGRWQDLAALKFHYNDPLKADRWLSRHA